MFEEIKKNALKWGMDSFGSLRQEFNFLGNPDIPPHEKVRMGAEKAHPHILPFTGLTGGAKIYAASFTVYKGLSFVGRENCEEASALLRGMTKDEIRKALDDMISRGSSPENALKGAQGLRQSLDALPEDTQIAMAETVDGVLPPHLKAALFQIWEYDTNLSVADRVRKWRGEIKAMSDQDLADRMTSGAKGAQADILTDAVYEITQKCTPEALESIVAHVRKEMSTKQLNAFLGSMVGFADEFCAAAKKGKLETVAGSKKSASFAEEARRMNVILEDAFMKAGLVPDSSPVEAYKKALAGGKGPSSLPPSPPAPSV